jgi:hypothetical protein
LDRKPSLEKTLSAYKGFALSAAYLLIGPELGMGGNLTIIALLTQATKVIDNYSNPLRSSRPLASSPVS